MHSYRQDCAGREEIGHGRHFGPHGGRGPWAWFRGRERGDEKHRGAGASEGREGGMFGHGSDRRWGRHDRHGFGFGRGPGRPERPLEQGDLKWLVLDLISAQPRHGYEIIKAIEEMTNGLYAPSPGVVYPTLTFLEETNLIVSETQGAKKLYSITGEGKAALEANSASIQAVRSRIEEARARFGNGPTPELARAMNNLRVAIQNRLTKGPLSDETLAAITTALDRAAGEIERS